jgi:hypothetical protein
MGDGLGRSVRVRMLLESLLDNVIRLMSDWGSMDDIPAESLRTDWCGASATPIWLRQ